MIERGVVVVVHELGGADLEQTGDPGGSQDALRGAADRGGVLEPAGADPVFEGEHRSVSVRPASSAVHWGVAPVAGIEGDDHTPGPIGQADVSGRGAPREGLGLVPVEYMIGAVS